MNFTIKRIQAAALGLGLAGLAFAAPAGLMAGPSGYHIVKKVVLPRDGGWDYLHWDASGGRVFVAHAGAVQVLDGKTLKLLGTIGDMGPKPHGIAFYPALNKGFATSGRPGSVVVFNLKTYRRIAVIHTPEDSDGILADPADSRVFVMAGDSHEIVAIDPKTDKVVGVVKLGTSLEAAAQDGRGHLYDNEDDASKVAKVDIRTLKVDAIWSTAPGRHPSGMAIDRATHRLFIGCRNGMLVVMNADDGKVEAHLPIGGHVDTTTFDAADGDVLDTCGAGSGTLSVIHEDSADRYHVVENVPTIPGARTMALNPADGTVYTAAARELPRAGGHGHRMVKGSFTVLKLER